MTLNSYDLGALTIVLSEGKDAPVALHSIRCGAGGVLSLGGAQPLVEAVDLVSGRERNNPRFTHSGLGGELRLAESPRMIVRDGSVTLEVVQEARQGDVRATCSLAARDGVDALEFRTRLSNVGGSPLHVTMLSALAFGFGVGADGDPGSLVAIVGKSEQLGENRWRAVPVLGNEGLADFGTEPNGRQPGRGSILGIGRSTWSTCHDLPVAGLHDLSSGTCVLWQLESNTGWRWEIDDDRDGSEMLSVILSGPTDLDHAALSVVLPGQELVSKGASLAFSTHGFDDAVRALTEHRRVLRTATTPQWDRMKVVFNDYMNTLNGDPSTERLLPLIEGAAALGAECFCIDCGWYDDTFTDWWATVGEWKPSTMRFPGGLAEVLDSIRAHGMRPGLWMEPEVVGVRSSVARSLSEDYFLHRRGVRVTEHLRYFLDYTRPAVRERMRAIFRSLIVELGIEYFKLDYNVTPGLGSDDVDRSPGAALRDQGDAYLSFIDSLRAEFPAVVFESCSSGAMRADPQTLRHFDLQSTSDQQDFARYHWIAIGAPMSMVPEQAGNWAYVQPEMTDAELCFTMLTGLAGRPYLSGHVDRFSARQRELVSSAVSTYKTERAVLVETSPRWPCGFPEWGEHVSVMSRVGADCEYVYVWVASRGEDVALCIPVARPMASVVRLMETPGWSVQCDGEAEVAVGLPAGEGVAALWLKLE